MVGTAPHDQIDRGVLVASRVAAVGAAAFGEGRHRPVARDGHARNAKCMIAITLGDVVALGGDEGGGVGENFGGGWGWEEESRGDPQAKRGAWNAPRKRSIRWARGRGDIRSA